MDQDQENVLVLENCFIHQNEHQVLSNVSFSIEKGAFVYLVGRTGSGKSSLLKTLYGDLPLKQGKANIAGFELKNIETNQIPYLRRKLGIIFQDFQLFHDRTVEENLAFVLKAIGENNQKKIVERITRVLADVGLESAKKKYTFQLSGGEQQRIVIARALLNDPILLVADEPTGNLDPEVSVEIMELFQRINNRGTSILMATHNHYLIEKFPGKILMCKDGKLIEGEFEED